MKKIVITLNFVLLIYSCNVNNNKNDLDKLKEEVEKYKIELVENKEVGTECIENSEEWGKIKYNSEQMYGLSEIEIDTFNLNDDNQLDAFVTLNFENCLGGNASPGAFYLLLYSKDGNYLTNKKISENIRDVILDKLPLMLKNDLGGIFLSPMKNNKKLIEVEFGVFTGQYKTPTFDGKGIYDLTENKLIDFQLNKILITD